MSQGEKADFNWPYSVEADYYDQVQVTLTEDDAGPGANDYLGSATLSPSELGSDGKTEYTFAGEDFEYTLGVEAF